MKTTSFTSRLLRDEVDLPRLRTFIKGLPGRSNLGDLEEQVQLPAVRSILRLWEDAEELVAAAYVDSYNNLRFEIQPAHRTEDLEQEIMDWGMACMRQRNADLGSGQTLDASSSADDLPRLAFLERFGFEQEPIRSLHYARPLDTPIEEFPLPPGFRLRSATGEDEVEALVSLHRLAFGSDHMTVEERLAIMRAPGYAPDMDLLAVAPDGEPAAFCICGMEGPATGYTDPIGAHPKYQRLGLGKAILSAGLRALKTRGATLAEIGTSSQNLPMQRLAERCGFTRVSEDLWFSKKLS